MNFKHFSKYRRVGLGIANFTSDKQATVLSKKKKIQSGVSKRLFPFRFTLVTISLLQQSLVWVTNTNSKEIWFFQVCVLAESTEFPSGVCYKATCRTWQQVRDNKTSISKTVQAAC